MEKTALIETIKVAITTGDAETLIKNTPNKGNYYYTNWDEIGGGFETEVTDYGYYTIDGVRVWIFSNTADAYNATQCNEECKSGDILVIPTENVVGVSHVYPTALTKETGDLHGIADDYSFDWFTGSITKNDYSDVANRVKDKNALRIAFEITQAYDLKSSDAKEQEQKEQNAREILDAVPATLEDLDKLAKEEAKANKEKLEAERMRGKSTLYYYADGNFEVAKVKSNGKTWSEIGEFVDGKWFVDQKFTEGGFPHADGDHYNEALEALHEYKYEMPYQAEIARREQQAWSNAFETNDEHAYETQMDSLRFPFDPQA
jgi:hypothetical protein